VTPSLTNFPRFKLSISFPCEEQARTFILGYHCLCESQKPEATQCKNHKHEEILCHHGQEFDTTTTDASEETLTHDLETKLAPHTFLVLQKAVHTRINQCM
jgi:hypothetical protein